MTAAVERTSDALREMILTGRYGAGERLGEAELASALGVSRTPVREALRVLSAEGLVEITTNRGARVIDYPRQELDSIFQLRARIEGMAARAAAERAGEDDIANLRRLAVAICEQAPQAGAGELTEIYRLNAEFHTTLNGLAGSVTLANSVAALVHSPVLLRTYHAFDPEALHRSAQHHLEIVAALRAHDPDWAEAVMHAHLLSARASLLGPRPIRPNQ